MRMCKCLDLIYPHITLEPGSAWARDAEDHGEQEKDIQKLDWADEGKLTSPTLNIILATIVIIVIILIIRIAVLIIAVIMVVVILVVIIITVVMVVIVVNIIVIIGRCPHHI